MADGSPFVTLWLGAADLAGLPGMPGTDRAIRDMAKREGWQSRPRIGRGGGVEYAFASLPASTQAALLLRHAPSPETVRLARPGAWSEDRIRAAWQRYERVPQDRKDAAVLKHKALLAVDALQRTGLGLMEAREHVAAQLQNDGHPCSPQTLARWRRIVDGCPRDTWRAALVDGYTGRTAEADVPARAWDVFKADYLRPEAPSATSCYRRLKRIAEAEGLVIPSLRTFERKIERTIYRPALIMARKGEEALDKTFPAQIRDRDVFAALEAVNADGHKFDVFVRFEDGTIGRPILMGVQDLLSGKILAYRLAQTESSDLVRLAFTDVVENYGIPKEAWLDNGRAFASKFLTGGAPNRYRFKVREEDPVGLLVGLGIKVHWTKPYNGQAKPIERAWRDLCDTVAKHPAFAGAYTGNKPDAKPENYGSRAVPIAEFRRVLQEEIVAHNAREGRRSKVCAGRSFDQVFAASYAITAVRKATAEQLRTMLLAAEAVSASSIDGSVRLAGNRYWHEALSAYAGQKLVLRFDPDNLHGQVAVYTLAGTFLCDADCTASVGFADTNAGREHSRAKNQYKRAAKAMLAAERRMDAATVAAQLPAPPPEVLPDSKVVSPLFKRPSKAEAPMRRTGTDDVPEREGQLRQLLQRMQAQQTGRRPDEDSP